MEFKFMRKWILTVGVLAFFQTARAVEFSTAPVVISTVEVPVEKKVIELRMYKKEVFVPEAKKGSKTKVNPLRRDRTKAEVNNGTCSGAFISPLGDILTAKHCVDGDVDLEVVTSDQKIYKAVVVATSPVHDLAIIHIDKRDTPFFLLAENVERGQVIRVLGSPLAITDVMSTGIVARIDGDVTMLDCSVLPGNSGGPAFDVNNRLVGVVTHVKVVLLGLTHLSAAQGVDAIGFFLNANRKKLDWLDPK